MLIIMIYIDAYVLYIAVCHKYNNTSIPMYIINIAMLADYTQLLSHLTIVVNCIYLLLFRLYKFAI